MSDKRDITYLYPVDEDTTLEVGDSFGLRGERGSRYNYIRTVHTSDSEWVDCYGGARGRGQFRSVFPDRIIKVRKKAE